MARRNPLSVHSDEARALACQVCRAECDKFNEPEKNDARGRVKIAWQPAARWSRSWVDITSNSPCFHVDYFVPNAE
jgi:Fe-S-cluster-containing dehydrogenase component